MPERIRIFNGAEELDTSGGKIVSSDDTVVDYVEFDILPNETVTTTSLIDFRKADGVTNIFTGKVNNIKKDQTWTVEIYGLGNELNSMHVEKVYQSTSPEGIVQDIIDNFSVGLTFASTNVSGFVIEKYIAKSYAIDIIRQMMITLDWDLTIDQSGNVYFRPKGEINNNRELINGQDFSVTEWVEDKDKIVNHYKIIGGFENHAKQETITGTNTEFSLTDKPSGTMRVVVSGTEVNPENYTVDSEGQKVVFNSTVTDPTFFYSFNIPIVVDNKTDESINLYDERFQEIPAPWLTSFQDARKYLSSLLSNTAFPDISAKGVIPFITYSVVVGEKVRVTDPIKGITRNLIVTKRTIDMQTGETIFDFGSRDYVLFDWQREVQQRIKDLERRVTSTTKETFARTIKSKILIKTKHTHKIYTQVPNNSFFFNHTTLGWMRSSRNREPDCSGNGHYGDWNGSDIDGDQYGGNKLIFNDITLIDGLVGYYDMHDKTGNFITDLYNDNDGTLYGSLTNGLVSYWKLDESSGTTASDSHGSNDGTVTGATWTTGKLGNALSFNGTSDYVDCGNDASFDVSDTFSVGCWFKSTMAGEWLRTIITKYGLTSITEFWGLGWIDTNVLGMVIRDSLSVRNDAVASVGEGLDGNWHYLTGVVSTTDVKFYIDGVLKQTTTRTAGSVLNDRPVMMGSHLTTYSEMELDEPAIWNRALTEDEVKKLYEEGNPTPYPLQDASYVSTEGKFGTAILFTDADTYVSVPNTVFDGLTNVSVFAWIKTSEETPDDYIFSNASVGSSLDEFCLALTDEGTKLTILNKGSVYASDSFDAINDGNWHHVGVIRDVVNEVLEVYVDKILVDSIDITGETSALEVDSNGSILGQKQGSVGGDLTNSWIGSIDEFGVWNRVITEEEINILFELESYKKTLRNRLVYGNFNGTDNYVEIPHSTDFNIADTLSVCFSSNLDSLPNTDKWIINKLDSNTGFGVKVNSDNKIEFVYGTGSSLESIESNEIIELNEWQNWAFTKNGTDLKLYLGENLNNSATATDGTIATNTEDLLIGKKDAIFYKTLYDSCVLNLNLEENPQ
jgi:hypothetical protein